MKEVQRIGALEGVRGLALMPVFAVHYVTLFGFLIGGKAESPAGWELAQTGVDLFFLLSGYLVYGLLLDGRVTAAEFLRRRARRIYPVYLMVFALYLGLSAVFSERSKMPHGWADGGWYVLVNLLLLPGFFDIPPLIRVAWSLSYELVFYTLLPAAVYVAGLARRPARVRVACLVGVAVAYWCACWMNGGWYLKGILLAPFGHPRLILFVAGMLVREAREAGWRPPGGLGWWMAWFGLVACGLWWNPVANQVRHQCVESALMALGGGPLIYWASLPCNLLARVLSWSGLRWLGKVSYSFYLLHGLVLHGLAYGLARVWNGFDGAWWFAGMLPVAMAAAAATAAVLYAQVERRLSFAAPAAGQKIGVELNRCAVKPRKQRFTSR